MTERYTIDEIQGFLKELVGTQGCYILMVDVPQHSQPGQDTRVLYSGPFTRLIGLLAFGGGIMDSRLLEDNVQSALEAMKKCDDPQEEDPS